MGGAYALLRLPAILDELADVETAARNTARILRTSAGELADRFAPRLGRLAQLSSDDRAAELKTLLGKARAAAARAAKTQGKMDALRQNAGAAIEDVLEQHRQAEDQLANVINRLGPANDERERLGLETVRLTEQARGRPREGRAGTAAGQPADAGADPAAGCPGRHRRGLRRRPPGPGTLLADVAAGLAAVKPYTKKTLRDRYDEARARLAGLGPRQRRPARRAGTYVLSYGERLLHPAPGGGPRHRARRQRGSGPRRR